MLLDKPGAYHDVSTKLAGCFVTNKVRQSRRAEVSKCHFPLFYVSLSLSLSLHFPLRFCLYLHCLFFFSLSLSLCFSLPKQGTTCSSILPGNPSIHEPYEPWHEPVHIFTPGNLIPGPTNRKFHKYQLQEIPLSKFVSQYPLKLGVSCRISSIGVDQYSQATFPISAFSAESHSLWWFPWAPHVFFFCLFWLTELLMHPPMVSRPTRPTREKHARLLSRGV